MNSARNDLFVLTADKHAEATMKALLRRHEALGIREITFTVARHPEHDSGCRVGSDQHVRPRMNSHEKAIVVFDKHGCGADSQTREEVQVATESRLNQNWSDRCKAIVIEPEVEAWIWNQSDGLAEALGWRNHANLEDWLKRQSLWPSNCIKPPNPKKAMDVALRFRRKPKSAATFSDLATILRFDHCIDPAFRDLRKVLQQWFSS